MAIDVEHQEGLLAPGAGKVHGSLAEKMLDEDFLRQSPGISEAETGEEVEESLLAVDRLGNVLLFQIVPDLQPPVPIIGQGHQPFGCLAAFPLFLLLLAPLHLPPKRKTAHLSSLGRRTRRSRLLLVCFASVFPASPNISFLEQIFQAEIR